ncbi:MAG: DNA repair protein RecO [Planctomycetota bacterium]
MAIQRDVAIVVRCVRFSETSQVVTLFSRRLGLVSLIAKGSLRRDRKGYGKFDGGLDLLDLGEAVFRHHPERELSTLTEWRQLNGHLGIRRRLRSIYLGMYAAELVGAVFEEHDAHATLFDRFAKLLGLLPTAQREEVTVAFTLEVLRQSGIVPELGRCAVSGQAVSEGPAYFSAAKGGVVLPENTVAIFDAMDLPFAGVTTMRRMLAGLATGQPQRLPRMSQEDADVLHRVLARHVQHAQGRRLRVPRFLLGETQDVLMHR